MPYNIEIASVDCQFGMTCYDFNLIDGDGVMPDVRRRYEIKKPQSEISENELMAIKNSIIDQQNATGKLYIQLTNDNNFLRQFIPLIENSLENLRLQLLNQVLANYNLTDSQKLIANNVIFTWKVNS